MNPAPTRLLRGLGLALLAMLPLGGALAQAGDYPNKAITIIVPFPPGGVTDQLARGVGQHMAEALKVPVIVDNRPGGGAQIAASAVKQAPADGYTILIGDIGALSLNAFLYPKLSYDPQRDFMPLARLILTPSLLVVPTNSPYATLDDFVKAAKTKPGGVSIASQGNGTGGHLFAEMLRLQTRASVNHVPYRGSAAALTDVMGGQVEGLFDAISTSGVFVKEGKVKALAIGSAQRSPVFPQIPTLLEQGQGDLAVVAWFGMLVKAGTPEAVVTRLSDAVLAALRVPELSKRFTDQGVEIAPLGPQAFKTFMDSEAQRWGKLIKELGIKLE